MKQDLLDIVKEVEDVSNVRSTPITMKGTKVPNLAAVFKLFVNAMPA